MSLPVVEPATESVVHRDNNPSSILSSSSLSFIGGSSHNNTNSTNMSRTVIEHRFGEQESLSLSTHNNNHNKKNGPLTVFARHRITFGKQDMFLAWVAEIDSVQRTKYKGYLGCEIVRPTPCRTDDDDANNNNNNNTNNKKSLEYVSIFRYENYELLQLWMDSEDRLRMLHKTCDFEDEPIVTSYHSLEYWFVPPETEQQLDQQQKPPTMPSRPKMTFVTFLVIWFQVMFVTPYTIGYIPKLPPWAAQGLGTLLIVVLTTYLFMPIATKYIFYWWLFPKTTTMKQQQSQSQSAATESSIPNPEKEKPTLSTSTTTVTQRDSTSLHYKEDDGNDNGGDKLEHGASSHNTNVQVLDELL